MDRTASFVYGSSDVSFQDYGSYIVSHGPLLLLTPSLIQCVFTYTLFTQIIHNMSGKELFVFGWSII